jgi:hypothetical protein
MTEYFDRYKEFRNNNQVKPIPGIQIPEVNTDKRDVYKSDSRMDKLSQKYYGAPFYGWLIMQCNQQYGGMEFDIPTNEIIRIPFPLKSAIDRYIEAVNEHKKLNG